MKKSTAQRLSLLALDMGAKLDKELELMQGECNEQEFLKYRRAIGEVMGVLLLEIMNPIYDLYPELKPDELE